MFPGHVTPIPIRSVVGDVAKLTDVRLAMKDVTAVIHSAGLVSFGTFPDISGMYQVNVKGTDGSLVRFAQCYVHTILSPGA